ncbi:hypothetical protein AB0N65_20510 [Paenarthrobacter sp. NPDC089322]|uniref:hypothetical protein n=1 Tax=Paenarthrobacter sp. NPDC089322 TaxID=3155065 RepID=UPI0034403338
MNHEFLGVVGIYLVLSAVALYMLRNFMAKAGVDGWSWLPNGSKFKTYKHQLMWSKVAAAVVASAGMVFLVMYLMTA